MTIAATQPEAGDVIAELLRRVSTLEKRNAEMEKALNDAGKRQAASETKHAAGEKRHADDAKDVAAVKAQIPFLATKAQLADFRAEVLTAISNAETRSEKNSKHNIMWIVGTGIALAAVIFAAPMLSAG